MLFFSRARQQLHKSKGSNTVASSYGVAAQAVLQDTRQDTDADRKIVGFELDAPAAMHAMMATTRKQSCNRPLRPGSTERITVSRISPRSVALEHRSRDSTVTGNDYLTRLQSALNACDTSQSLPSPEPQVSWQHRRPASMTAAALPCPRRPEGRGSGGRWQSVRSTTPSLGVTTLVKEWVKAVEKKATAAVLTKGSTEVCMEKSLLTMPAFCMPPSRAGQLSTDSCVARLLQSKFRPVSASWMPDEPCAASAGRDVAEEAAAQPPWRHRLLAEPIQSYRLLKDAVVSPVKPTPSSLVPVLGSARIRRDNLERLRHSFEHQRLKLQGELEDKLEWRNRCRSALLRHNSAEDRAAVVPAHSPSTAPSTPQGAGERAMRTPLLAEVFGGPSGSAARLHQLVESPHLYSLMLGSIWSHEAARQAVQQEKSRLVALLQSFVVTCSAAVLTLAAMEKLRSETIRLVWHPEENSGSHHAALLHREQFLKFLWGRYEAHTSGLLGAVDTVRPIDIIDALPSQAEASFARYAYEVLPTAAE
ncbi:conserved hypothetical protein [Leishmania major strain Friedlin]|uniref:Uncharacterized protein n=1 Tax=Leishmania major TaxID=5664 RepID=E9AFX6_LEIMA|nr:conserved hypothetical protein [Leishmania major strain Friedlin]CAG9582859.1 hypothetical_protein_-_conserved [Leishmania major strain Friedlin]CBZ13131.1 conserved hypothetical protein [Leishmania major strain Friedlin]|eukprot:XP_003722896.1 conserved hypothetical protein [Leishmania major strain Friedlin]